MLKCLFNKSAGLKPAALLKRDSSKSAFPSILRDFLEDLFCIRYVIENRHSQRYYTESMFSKISPNSRQNSFERLLLILARIDPVKPRFKQRIKVDDTTQMITGLYLLSRRL